MSVGSDYDNPVLLPGPSARPSRHTLPLSLATWLLYPQIKWYQEKCSLNNADRYSQFCFWGKYALASPELENQGQKQMDDIMHVCVNAI